MRHWLTGGNGGRRIAELDDIGIILKTVPINPGNRRPWEATSFPAIDIGELVECESFDDHFMSEEVSSILFVPTLRESRKVHGPMFVSGRRFSASDDEWRIMEEEWRMFRDVLRCQNGASEIPTAKETRIFHLRPKSKEQHCTGHRALGRHNEAVLLVEPKLRPVRTASRELVPRKSSIEC